MRTIGTGLVAFGLLLWGFSLFTFILSTMATNIDQKGTLAFGWLFCGAVGVLPLVIGALLCIAFRKADAAPSGN